MLIAAALVAGGAQAEVSKVRISRQFGLPYLPMIVIEDQHLIEKNAKAAGLGDVETEWTQRAGPGGRSRCAARRPGRFHRAGRSDARHRLGQDRRHAAGGARADRDAVDALRAGDAQSGRQDHRRLHRQGQDRAAGGQADRPRHRAGNGSSQDLGTGALRQARFHHHHALACRCGGGADSRQLGDQFAFRQRAVLLLRAGDTGHPSGAEVL